MQVSWPHLELDFSTLLVIFFYLISPFLMVASITRQSFFVVVVGLMGLLLELMGLLFGGRGFP